MPSFHPPLRSRLPSMLARAQVAKLHFAIPWSDPAANRRIAMSVATDQVIHQKQWLFTL